MNDDHIITRLHAEYLVSMASPVLSDAEKIALSAEYYEAVQGLPEPRWCCNSGPQALAYITEADELFYGGAAGGGKTSMLLGLSLTAHRHSLILRRYGTELVEMKKQLDEMRKPSDRWRNIGHGGDIRTYDSRFMEMLGCDDERRANKLQGRAHDLKAWDEVCQFNENTFRFVNQWCRTKIVGQRCRVVGVGNPPLAAEEEWVLRYWGPWLDDTNPSYPARPGELRWFTTNPLTGKDEEVADNRTVEVTYGGKSFTIRPISRTFIPASLSDNPDLMATDYASRLAAAREPYRTQLLFGDMRVGRLDHDAQVIPSDWVQRSMKRDWKPNGRGDKRMDAAGIDCAMKGRDRMALAKRYDNWIAPILTWPGKDITEGKDALERLLPCLESLHMPILIDVLATAGGSVVQSFREKFRDLIHIPILLYPINFGEKSQFIGASGRLEFSNKRAEAYWRIREALDPTLGPPETRLQLPDDSELAAELCNVRSKTVGGRILLEPKEDIQDRLGRSPDKADAVAMTMLTYGSTKAWLPVPAAHNTSPHIKPAGFEINRSGSVSYGSMGNSGGFMGMGSG